MASFYVETSGLFKRYRTERGSDILDQLFDQRRPSDRLLTAYFTTVEIEAVAARMLRGAIITLPTYFALLSRYGADLAGGLELEPTSNTLIQGAADVAQEFALRAPDAIHLATAREARRAGASRLVFVTSDREILDAARRDGFDLLDPEDADALGILAMYRS